MRVVFSDLPSWLIQGIGIGVGAAVFVLIVNLIGVRYLDLGPTSETSVDADELKRAEVRAYLTAIGEPFIEEMPIDTIEVEFWLPERKIAITFDPHIYFELIENGHGVVLLEHEVPGEQIGSRLPFDTPTLRSTRVGGDDLQWAYETLEVATDASREQIDTAYRDRVLEAHPDRGGDAKELEEILLAYDRLTGERTS